MPKEIAQHKRDSILSLYKKGTIKVSDIAKEVGVSTTTIYTTLRKSGIKIGTRQPKKKAIISFDKETCDIINQKKPRILSAFVCDCIKKIHGK